MKLCRDCAHYKTGLMPECRHTGNLNATPDYVNGGEHRWEYATAQAVRVIRDMCGPEGKWLEERS